MERELTQKTRDKRYKKNKINTLKEEKNEEMN
jgi:hypothetical protein